MHLRSENVISTVFSGLRQHNDAALQHLPGVGSEHSATRCADGLAQEHPSITRAFAIPTSAVHLLLRKRPMKSIASDVGGVGVGTIARRNRKQTAHLISRAVVTHGLQ
jgi:hypothetical protein